MNLDRLRLWAEALRSGEFEQGRGTLKRRRVYDGRDEYCCLGVLCEVAIREGVPLVESPDAFAPDCFTFDGYHWSLPDAVVEWLGASDSQIKIIGPGGCCIADPVLANDHKRWTFREIADGLELYAQQHLENRKEEHAEQG